MTCSLNWWQSWEWLRISFWWLVKKRLQIPCIKRSLTRLQQSTTSSPSRDWWLSATLNWMSKQSKCWRARLNSSSNLPHNSKHLWRVLSNQFPQLQSKLLRKWKSLRRWLRLKKELRRSWCDRLWKCHSEKSRKRNNRLIKRRKRSWRGSLKWVSEKRKKGCTKCRSKRSNKGSRLRRQIASKLKLLKLKYLLLLYKNNLFHSSLCLKMHRKCSLNHQPIQPLLFRNSSKLKKSKRQISSLHHNCLLSESLSYLQ